MQFQPPIPILRIFDLAQARAFYVDWLGMHWDWEHRFGADHPLYAQVSRAPLVLHLSEHHGDATPGATVFIPMSGIAALHAELAARPYRYQKPGLHTVDWGQELVLTDPFGNRLRFCERSAAAQASPAPAAPRGLTRAEVRAEYLRARAAGELPPTGEVG